MSTPTLPSLSLPLSNGFRVAALAGLLTLATALPAVAGEAAAEMQRVHDGAAGSVIGKVLLSEAADGVALKIDLTELPPGPNRLFLYPAGDCALPKGELLENPLATVNVNTDEGGAIPLRTSLMVPGKTLAEMTGKSLVVYRGSQQADLGPVFTGQPRLVACGVVK